MKTSINIAVFSIVALAGLVMLSLIGFSRYTHQIAIRAQPEILRVGELNFALGRFENDFLLARRAEKDFLLRLDERYAQRHADAIVSLYSELGEIDAWLSLIGGMEGTGEDVASLKSAISAYQEDFETLVRSKLRMGLDEDSGLQGQLRRAVHGVEAALENSGRHELRAKMLMMRRHEKDFILRNDTRYLVALNARVEEFHRFPSSHFDSADQQAEIHRLLSVYQATFESFVHETIRESDLRMALSQKFAAAEPLLSSIHTHALARLEGILAEAEAESEALQSQSLVVGLVGLFIFVSFAFLVAQAILRPLGQVNRALLDMTKGNFSKVQAKSNITELSAILDAVGDFQQARDKVLAAERAKAKLLTVMSHEMRTPLTGVLGSVDLLETTSTTAEQDGYLNAMRVSGELLLHHVNEVLELAGLEAGNDSRKPYSFDLQELMHGLVNSQQANARAGGNKLELHVQLNGSPYVLGHPHQIQKAVLNLIGNALKFTENGSVSFHVERQGESDQVEFLISDTGTGIAPADLDRIFDDFVKLDTSYSRTSEGTGLGLAITRRIVEVLGGVIEAKSDPGDGSEFRMVLPLPSTTEPSIDSSLEAQKPSTSKHLLVVEDNDINRVLLAKTLEKMGHQVTTVIGGAEAIEVVSHEKFDLILMDISMPEVDGTEALRRMRAQNLVDGVDVVALTAHVAEYDQRRIMESGFAEVATKPISRSALERLVARYTDAEPTV